MPELKYLKDNKIVFRDEPFVMDVIYSMEKGNASIQLYDIFPGVQLMVTDFQSDTCYQSGMEQDVISIEHCLKGRFECMFDNRNCVYMGPGDVAINNDW